MTEYYSMTSVCKDDILDKAIQMNVVISDEELESIIANLADEGNRSEAFMEQFWLEIEHNIELSKEIK